MIQVRQGVFETNSSSTHSITICPESDFERWKNGDVWLSVDGYGTNVDAQFLTKEEAISAAERSGYPPKKNLYDVSNDDLDWYLAEDYEIYSYDKYFDMYDGYEYYDKSYTTQHGDKIVAFGYYGRS